MDTLPITTPRQAGIYVRQAREAQGITRAALGRGPKCRKGLVRLQFGPARHRRKMAFLVERVVCLRLALAGHSSARRCHRHSARQAVGDF